MQLPEHLERMLQDFPERERDQVRERYLAIQPFLDEHVSSLHVLAKEYAVSVRTLQRWVAAYRRDGLDGLLPRRRSDKGRPRVAAPIVDLVTTLYATREVTSIKQIYRDVALLAQQQNLTPPSYSQVRAIVENIQRAKPPTLVAAQGGAPELPLAHTPDQDAIDHSVLNTIVTINSLHELRLHTQDEHMRLHEFIAVDAEMESVASLGMDAPPLQPVRIWAQVQRIEAVNTLLLAPFDNGSRIHYDSSRVPKSTPVTHLVTCRILGYEPVQDQRGHLQPLRSMIRSITPAYRPTPEAIARILAAHMQWDTRQSAAAAVLAAHPEVVVPLDHMLLAGHSTAVLGASSDNTDTLIRSLLSAALAAGTSVILFESSESSHIHTYTTGRRENVQYCVVPPGDLLDTADDVSTLLHALGMPVADIVQPYLEQVSAAARYVRGRSEREQARIAATLAAILGVPEPVITEAVMSVQLIGYLAEAGAAVLQNHDTQQQQELAEWQWSAARHYSTEAYHPLFRITQDIARAVAKIADLEQQYRQPPGSILIQMRDSRKLRQPGILSVVSLAGYPGELHQLLYSRILGFQLLDAAMYTLVSKYDYCDFDHELSPLSLLIVLEPAESFAVKEPRTTSEHRVRQRVRKLAEMGQEHGIRLLLRSEHPHLVDEHILAQCRSWLLFRMKQPADVTCVRASTASPDDISLLAHLGDDEALVADDDIPGSLLVRLVTNEMGDRQT
jgi:hypothetical protein